MMCMHDLIKLQFCAATYASPVIVFFRYNVLQREFVSLLSPLGLKIEPSKLGHGFLENIYLVVEI